MPASRRLFFRVGVVALMILLVTNFLELRRTFSPWNDEQLKEPVNTRRWHSSQSTLPKLILISPTNRPYYLTRQLHFVLPLRNCFDVRWFIIHRVEPEVTAFAPAFREQFPWIDEVRTYNNDSSYGGDERNFGRELAINSTNDDAMVYFLDDDNIMPDLCKVVNTRTLNLQTLYYADQFHCDKLRLPTTEKNWAEYWNKTSIFENQLKYKMDTASFLIPLASLRRSRHVLWGLRAVSDTPFFAAVLSIWLEYRGPRFVKRLPEVQFTYNTLSDRNGCLRKPWSKSMLRESYAEYKDLVGNMTAYFDGFPVVPHDYAHILSTIRRALPADQPMTYVELGVGLGATSLLMSRHELPTNVIGVDTFASPQQKNKATKLQFAFQGKGSIDWVQGAPQDVLATVKSIVASKLRVSKIDILLINADHSPASVIADFEAYSPLVAKGGFVVFDEFEDTLRIDGGVRKALMMLIEQKRIRLDQYDVIGTVKNVARAGPTTPDPDNRDWPSCSSKEFILRKKRWAQEPPPLPKLILLTVTTQPHYLPRILPTVQALLTCFDVKWIIVHRVEPGVTSYAAAFRNHFSWILETRAFSDDHSGTHERSLGIELALNTTRDDALVYFLDEDNTMPDLCSVVNTAKVHMETLYYADQARCGELRLNTLKLDLTDYKNFSYIYETQVRDQLHNGSFLVPLIALRHLQTRPTLPHELVVIGDFFTTLIYLWSDAKGPDYVKRLPGVSFNYKHVNDHNGCQRHPWRRSTLDESLEDYRQLLGTMTSQREQTSKEHLSDLTVVVPHEYGHFLSALRWSLPSATPATYVELGVGIGATSLLMSRHSLLTNVIGVDTFQAARQRKDADAMRASLKGKGSMNWITADPLAGAADVRNALTQKLNTTAVDILMINGDHSTTAVIAYYEQYSPLVVEGGFLVFDEYLDNTLGGDGVRKALMILMGDGRINASQYEFIGSISNEARAGTFLTADPDQRDWPQEMSKLFVLRRKPNETSPVTRPMLILITNTTAGRSFYLLRSLPAVLALRDCFDVRWIVVHRIDNDVAAFAPTFRDHFSWISEVRAYSNEDASGVYERNMGVDMAIKVTRGNALVYFLSDDNTPPDLCSTLTNTVVLPETLYYADLGHCGLVREPSRHRNWTEFNNQKSVLEKQIQGKMDWGNFLFPLELLQSARSVNTSLPSPIYLTTLVTMWIAQNGPDFIKRMPNVRFHFEQLNDHYGCTRKPWSTSLFSASLDDYRQLLGNMTAQREQSSRDRLSDFETVVPHEYGHILSSIRWSLSSLDHATYLEIGVGLGATSMLMSRHPLLTNVIGVDPFSLRSQKEDADALRATFQGQGTISWIQSGINSSFKHVERTLGALRVPHVDILLINVERSPHTVIEAWDLFSPLVGIGGFVVFDEYLDNTIGVRKAIMTLIEDGRINAKDFDVIGAVANDAHAGPYLTPDPDQRDWPLGTSKVFVLRRRRWPNEPQPQQKLIAITTTNRSHYLTRTLPFVMGLRNCFDVRWIIVHQSDPDAPSVVAPAFRSQFWWVTEVMQSYDADRKTHDRRVGIEAALNVTLDDALVYFLDDDTIIPYLCSTLPVTASLPERLHFGDQAQCGKIRQRSNDMMWSDYMNIESMHKSQLQGRMNIGNFIVPLASLRLTSPEQRELPGTMLIATLISIWIQHRGVDAVRRLPNIRFHLNHLGERSGCLKNPFSKSLLKESLEDYRKLLGFMSKHREEPQTKLSETFVVVPHEYGFIVSAIRWILPAVVPATYVEVGIGLGATSLLMSRHTLPTNVIGVDKFSIPNQREDAEALRSAFQGKGSIEWIDGESQTSFQLVQDSLQKVQHAKIDILMINSDHTTASVMADFELYSPLVADGGYIVFDECFDSVSVGYGVRAAIMQLLDSRARGFEVIGPLENDADAALCLTNDPHLRDWPKDVTKTFILRKRNSTESPTGWRDRALAVRRERMTKKPVREMKSFHMKQGKNMGHSLKLKMQYL